MFKLINKISIFLVLIASTSYLYAGQTGYQTIRSIEVHTNASGTIAEVRFENYQFTGCTGTGVGPSLALKILDSTSSLNSVGVMAVLSTLQAARLANRPVNVTWNTCIGTTGIIGTVMSGPYP